MINFFKLCFTCDNIKGSKKEVQLDVIGNEPSSKEPTAEAKSMPLDDSVRYERKSEKSVTEDYYKDVNEPSITKNTQSNTNVYKKTRKRKNESGEIPSNYVKYLRNDLLKSAFN